MFDTLLAWGEDYNLYERLKSNNIREALECLFYTIAKWFAQAISIKESPLWAIDACLCVSN